MAKENENLESTEETVEEVVADKDAEQASPSLVKKRKKKLNVLKRKRHVMLVNPAQVAASSEVLPL